MNKKAQQFGIEQIFLGFLMLVITLGFLSILPSILNPCSQEKARIGELESSLVICNGQLVNQTQLINDFNEQCNKRVVNETSQCKDSLNLNLNIVNSYRTIFIIYHITIALIFVLSLNLFFGLFKLEFKFDFGEPVNKIIKYVKYCWIGFKWILFAISVLFLLLILSYLLFPHWFY